jgi:hypothetical protein
MSFKLLRDQELAGNIEFVFLGITGKFDYL